MELIERHCKDPDTKPRRVKGPSGIEYTFQLLDPADKRSPRTAKIENKQDIQAFLGIPEGYRILTLAGKGFERPTAAFASAVSEFATTVVNPVDPPPASPPATPPASPPAAAAAAKTKKTVDLSLPVPKLRKSLVGKHGISDASLQEAVINERAGKNRSTVINAIQAELGG